MHWANKIDSEDYTILELQAKQRAEVLYRLCKCGREVLYRLCQCGREVLYRLCHCGREGLYRRLAKVCSLSRYKRFFEVEDIGSYFF